MRCALRLLTVRQFHTITGRVVENQTSDVVLGDLGATLAAHRWSNLSRKIHKHYAQDGDLAKGAFSNPGRDLARLNHITLREPSPKQLAEGEDAELTKESHGEATRSKDDAVEEGTRNFRRWKEKQDQKAAKAFGEYVKPYTYRDRYRHAPYLTQEDVLQQPIEGREKLEHLIRDFDHWISLTTEETSARERLVDSIVKQMQKRDNNVQFVTFGSMATGLATPLSDIDVGMSLNNPREVLSTQRARKIRIKKLQQLQQSIHRMRSIDVQYLVRSARVPLLNLRHGPSQVELQIVGVDNADSRILHIKNWIDEFPQFKPIYLIVKTLLDVRGLSEPRFGGVGGYTLICMIVAFLRLAGTTKQDDVGSTLWAFLDFYAYFNTQTCGISVEPTAVFQKRAQHHVATSSSVKDRSAEDELIYWQQELSKATAGQPWLLCLQDPFDLSSDLGKSTTRIMDIRMTFRVLSQRLRSWLTGTPERQKEDPLMPFFGKMLGLVRDKRKELLRYSRLPGNYHLDVLALQQADKSKLPLIDSTASQPEGSVPAIRYETTGNARQTTERRREAFVRESRPESNATSLSGE